MLKLPESFIETFTSLLGTEPYRAFEQALQGDRTRGLRVNTLKVSVQEYLTRTEWQLDPVVWSRDGFYQRSDVSPGTHPDYHAGLFYLQDPSAMLPAEMLDVKPGELVLDLCAAPGGKTVQLAAMMRNQGLLVANDISPKRVKPLRRNLENLGVACSVVTNTSPGRMREVWPAFFDAILLDVPCSGEGMFRKDETAIRSWKRHDAEALQQLQRDILSDAWAMLRPGGRLVYSTCTFNPDENERNIAWALERFPDMHVMEVPIKAEGLSSGRDDWTDGCTAVQQAVRIWPQFAEGEGHFAVLLGKRLENGCTVGVSLRKQDKQRNGQSVQAGRKKTKNEKTDLQRNEFRGAVEPASSDALGAFAAFVESALVPETRLVGSERRLLEEGSVVCQGNALFLMPDEALGTMNLPYEMPGLMLGEWRHGRFEPSSALLHALTPDAARHRLELSGNSDQVNRYLHGETLMREGEKGWTAVLVDGFPLGWGKQEDGFMKNRYPKGWRML